MLKCQQINGVLLRCEIDLQSLYPDPTDRQQFERNYIAFLESDWSHKDIFNLTGDRLAYKSEQLIPTAMDERPFLLFVFGNPASHSIQHGMFFSYEGAGREHRFWSQILRGSGIADLTRNPGELTETASQDRKEKLLILRYNSIYRLALTVFFTFPSPAIGPWAGVAGIRRLFGKKAFDIIKKEEGNRIQALVKSLNSKHGAVLTFQKDAWLELSGGTSDQAYLIKSKKGELCGSIGDQIPLFGLPPTRLSKSCSGTLRQILKHVGSDGYDSINSLTGLEIACDFYSGHNFNLKMKNGNMALYSYVDYGKLIKNGEVSFSEEVRKKFITICRDADICSWKARYQNPNILDGWSWGVKFKVGEKLFETSGSNAGPEKLGLFMNSVVALFNLK